MEHGPRKQSSTLWEITPGALWDVYKEHRQFIWVIPETWRWYDEWEKHLQPACNLSKLTKHVKLSAGLTDSISTEIHLRTSSIAFLMNIYSEVCLFLSVLDFLCLSMLSCKSKCTPFVCCWKSYTSKCWVFTLCEDYKICKLICMHAGNYWFCWILIYSVAY